MCVSQCVLVGVCGRITSVIAADDDSLRDSQIDLCSARRRYIAVQAQTSPLLKQPQFPIELALS